MNQSTPTTRQQPLRAVWRALLLSVCRLGWFGLWLAGTLLALLLALGLAFWLWAGTPGSLAQSLSWVQSYMEKHAPSTGTLDLSGVQGSLRGGGQIDRLQWSRAELRVQANGVQLRLGDPFWIDALLGRGLHPTGLTIARLHISDQRAPRPRQPLHALPLPLAISLPWSIDELLLDAPQPLHLHTLKGWYRYGRTDVPMAAGVPDAHQLEVESLQLASGRYRLQARLGAQAPMPLTLHAQGTVRTSLPQGHSLNLQATASVHGTLSASAATLDIGARVWPEAGAGGDTAAGTPTLVASARVLPWAPQPLLRADASAHQLDLSALWPRAPLTSLSGTLTAQPEGDAWRARVRLSNAASGPADRQRLPLQHLQADVEQRAGHWSVSQIDAGIGGGQMRGSVQVHRPPGTDSRTLGTWQGALQASGINPALLWSTLAEAALDGTLSAGSEDLGGSREAITLLARIQPSQQQPAAGRLAGLRLRELHLQGRWQPAPGDPSRGVLDLHEARLSMTDVQLHTRGQLDTAARQYTGQITLRLPGAQAQWSGLLAHGHGYGRAELQLDAAERTLAWVRSLHRLPLLGPLLRGPLQQWTELTLQGNARLSAHWQGGLGALGYPAAASRSPLLPTQATSQPPGPQLQATLELPRLLLQTRAHSAPFTLNDLHLRAHGSLDDLQLDLRGCAARAPWSAELQTQGRLLLTRPAAATSGPAWRNGQLNLGRLLLRLSDTSRSDRVTDWHLQTPQPVALRWGSDATGAAPASARTQPGAARLWLDAGTGQLQLQPSVRQRASAPALTACRGFGAAHENRPQPDPMSPKLPPNSTDSDGGAAVPAEPLTLEWDSLTWQAQGLQTQGRLRGLPQGWIDLLGRAEHARSGPLSQLGISGNLMFDGHWDLLLSADPRTPVRLTAQLQRRSGDLTMHTGDSASPAQRLQAGVQDARLNLNTHGHTVQANLRWTSEHLGHASAEISSDLSSHELGGDSALARWWPASAPLRGSARVQLPQVDIWSVLAPPGWRMRGTLAADVVLSGTRGTPHWSGSLQADQIALYSTVDGFAFTSGELRATLNSERLTIDRLHLQGPGGADVGGTLSATGAAEWRRAPGQTLRQPFIELQATASRLRVSSHVDRRLTLCGQINARLAGPLLQIRGQLSADSAQFILPDELTPTRGRDVVLRGTHSLPEPSNGARVQTDVLIDLDLGPQFHVQGRGLQTRLSGQLSVRSTPDQPTPRVLGEVRTVNGSYRAYGQQLQIETGVLRFVGPYDDPTLDILALRSLPAAANQRVGVHISGSAQAVRVRLFSDPELPDAEKLAWLVIGRPATGAGAETAVLQQAALALLGGHGSALDGGLARAFGLDELGLRTQAIQADGTLRGAAIILGKRLSRDLYLSYERSLVGTLGTVSIFYDISRHLTLRARAGEESALDLIFTVRYD